MAEAEGIDKIRPTDGKLERRKYDPQIKRRARLMWCLLGKDTPVEEQLGLPQGTLTVWRQRKQPDGVDWYEFREELDISERDRDFGMAGPHEEIEFRMQLVDQAHKLAAIAMASLDSGQLFDADGNEVRWLFNKDGTRIKVGGIRPTSQTQVTEAVKAAAQIITVQMDRLMELGLEEDQMRGAIAQVMQIFWNTVVETIDLTEGQRRGLEAALQEAGKRAGRLTLSEAKEPAEEV